jgi:hypothetical protein
LTPAHDILFWDQVIETDQSRFFVLRRILFGFSVISIHAKPFWAKLKRTGASEARRKKGGLTPAGRKRLSQLMKAQWAARRRTAGKK